MAVCEACGFKATSMAQTTKILQQQPVVCVGLHCNLSPHWYANNVVLLSLKDDI